MTGEPDWVHEVRLLNRLKQLEKCYQEVAKARVARPSAVGAGLFLGVVLGFIAAPFTGWLLYMILHEGFNVNYGTANTVAWVLAGIPTFIAFVWVSIRLCIRGWKREVLRTKNELVTATNVVVDEFPQEVESWGGPMVLEDREVVRELVRQQKERRGEPTEPGK